MGSSLVRHARIIECPSDLSEYHSLTIGSKRLLYLRSRTGSMRFVIVIGFYAGQKQDVVKKDLIEPVQEEDKEMITCKIAPECDEAHILFL